MADRPASLSDQQRQAEVVSEHLPEGYTGEFHTNTRNGSASKGQKPSSGTNGAANDNGNSSLEQESSLTLQGGDIHRDLFRLNNPANQSLQRSATFSAPTRNHWDDDEEDDALAPSQQRVPGGFRRQFVQQKMRSRFDTANLPVTRNFVEFLDLYGSFAGEDLHESDDEAIADDSEDETERAAEEERHRPGEERPLLGRRKSTKRQAKKGDAGMVKSFFTLLKAFIGTGIMFLPKAFNNGGILFSSLTMLAVSAVSMLAFHLLLQCRSAYGGGYGDLGKSIGGPKLRALILGSITLSQLGFVCAGMVFVAENLYAFSEAVSKGPTVPLPIQALIAIQLVVLIPLSFIRDISKLGPAALLADVFIMIGLTYIYYFDIATIVTRGGIDPSVQLFNPKHFTLTIGSAIFTFEGIGLILPIQSSMKAPQNFEYLLGVVMLLITVIFTSVGALCYATFGENTAIEIISNYPQDNKLVNAVQFLYSLAVLFGNPVQLFPAIRILEGKIFGHHTSGKKSPLTKWKKNAFRALLVVLCGGISIAGASNLDKFVALIGSFACVPLVYIYPPLLHYWGVAETNKAKWGDLVFVGLGVVAMVYTTGVTVVSSFT